MKKGTKVSWLVDGCAKRGNGITISDEDDTGHIVVAVNSLMGEVLNYHPVINCTVTWLTVEE